MSEQPVQSIARTFHVVIADEDEANREMVESVLSVYGYRISTASDGVAAWKAAFEAPTDLAIISLTLPGLNGFDFIARARVAPSTANMAIMVMSSADDPGVCERAFGLGATAYLMKPLKWPVLTHNVWYILRNQVRDAEMMALKVKLGIERPSARTFDLAS